MNDNLSAPFGREEVEYAIKQMFLTKALGPDGFRALFYHQYWNIVGPKTVETCLHILNQGGSIANWNNTHIVLIPKVMMPRSVSEFRPISLCNVSYKIITKVIANRLKKVIGLVISDAQSAFIPDRAITNNIIIGHECLHFLRQLRSRDGGIAALKLDLSKAFDCVEWAYLEGLMLKIGFSPDFVLLIMHCLSTVRFSVLIKGEPKGSFSSSRGIRQGDPLSPYLFILCAEGLSQMIHHTTSINRLSGISFGPYCPIISHLLFADDSLIFLKAFESESSYLKGLLVAYGRASSQCINFSKSALLFSPNVHIERQKFLQTILGVQLVPNLGTYLTVHLCLPVGNGLIGVFSKIGFGSLFRAGSRISFLLMEKKS